MAVPDYQAMMLPVLKLFAGGAKNVSECIPLLKQQFSLTDEEASELIPSGKISILGSRAHWARTYLSKAGLLTSPKRNHHVITELGKKLLATKPSQIDLKVLSQYEGFDEWLTASLKPKDGVTSGQGLPETAVDEPSDNQKTPEEMMASAQAVLDGALRDEILTILKDISPVRFERLILDLLSAMGYGGGNLANTQMTKTSGDGGIDGIIHEDALGLDAVYIQAKRYAPDNKVSRPAIQQFIGTLTGEGATKGVFVTTSDFSAEAHSYLGKVQHRVVLINGQRLAQLMIRHGVGVRSRNSFVIKGIDEDYFSDLNAG